jgi:PAS domain S-box-containing protein
VRANSSMCRMLGYSEEELLSLSVHEIHPPESLPHVLDKFRQNVEGKLWIAEDIPVLRRDGTVFYADIASNRLDYRGHPCTIGFFRDVTERTQAQEALERERRSLWKMLQASDHERQVISYEIHDGLAQYLASAAMQFQAYQALRRNSPREARKAYKTAVELVRQAHFESRRLISEVRPPVIDEIGLETAISHLVHEQRRHGGPKIKFDSDVQFGRLPSILENALYRIVQEALTNACKHSQSEKVTVTLAQEDHEVRLEVRDWGIGFDPAAVENGHFGLEGIRQRVRLLGGRLAIESAPGSGASVQVVVPIPEKPIEE